MTWYHLYVEYKKAKLLETESGMRLPGAERGGIGSCRLRVQTYNC